jgi:hypothetical protein
MNSPRDPCLTELSTVHIEPAEGAWRSAEARLRRYVALLDHPNAELLVTLSLRHAAELVRDDPSLDPARAALLELHRLLAEEDGTQPESTVEAAFAARLRRWNGGEPALRSMPPIRRQPMAPEGLSSASRRKGLPDGRQATPAAPSLGRLRMKLQSR